MLNVNVLLSIQCLPTSVLEYFFAYNEADTKYISLKSYGSEGVYLTAYVCTSNAEQLRLLLPCYITKVIYR